MSKPEPGINAAQLSQLKVRFYYETHDELRKHLADFVAAYNYARRLKTLRGLTPYEAICKAWSESPSLFTANPYHQLPGPNI